MSVFDDIKAELLTRFGDIQLQTGPPLVRAAHCRHALHYAKPGMVICRRYDYYLDGKFIPGHYSHSGIIESSDGDNINKAGTVLHAIAEGVVRDDILDFVKDTDGFVILEFKPPYDTTAVIEHARSLYGTKYDFDFSIMDKGKMLYCHEFSSVQVNWGYRHVHPKGVILPELTTVGPISREVYTASSLITSYLAKNVYEAQVKRED